MKKKYVLCGFAGIVTALCQTLGMILVQMQNGNRITSRMLLQDGENGFLWGTAAFLGFLLFGRAAGKLFAPCREEKRILLNPLVYQAILFVAWLPCYLAYFPAIYSYDGEPQLIQYTTHAFDNHHPILHTLILGWCYDLGQLLQHIGVSLDGMAVYAFLQMLLLSAAFAHGISFLAKRYAKRSVLIFVTAWFALFPVYPLMAVSTTKDTFFGAYFTFFFIDLADVMLEGKMAGKRQAVFLFLEALCMMLFRKNGIYMMAGLAFFLFAFWGSSCIKKREHNKLYSALLLVTVMSMLGFMCCDKALMKATNAVPGEAAEALSIPLQQLARTYKSNQDTLCEEDLEALFSYIPADGLNNYRPYISDGVKQYFDNDAFAKDPLGFFKIWGKLFVKYPGSCVTAFLYHTMGSWYPSDVSHSMVYQNWWRDRIGYFITDAIPVFAGDFVEKENLWPQVRSLYEKIATDCVHQRFILTALLFAPYPYCFGTVLAAVSLLAKKRHRLFLCAVPVLVNLLTVIAGPCILVRYIYPFMALLPFLIAFVYWPDSLFTREETLLSKDMREKEY